MDLSLLDWRRRVADLYARVRTTTDGAMAWRTWIAGRDHLVAHHAQTPLDAPATFVGLDYFDHDPSWRLTGTFVSIDHGTPSARLQLAHSGDGSTPARQIGTVAFTRAGVASDLDVFWLDSYGGGLFLPFRDRTCGDTTYGGGRYLLDTVKGADLGHVGNRMVLDFNFAYHPSCVYSSRWSCPLAPPGNHLDVAVAAGERLPRP